MPKLFLDHAADHDIAIHDQSNWTINEGVMPNGDNAAERTSFSTTNECRSFGIVGSSLEIAQVERTLAFWIRPHTDWGTNQMILLTGTFVGEPVATNSGSLLGCYTNGTVGSPLKAQLYAVSNRGIAINIPLTFDEWHFVCILAKTTYAFTTSSAGTINSIVDGVSGPSGSSGGTNSFRPPGAGADHGLHVTTWTDESPYELAHISWFNRFLTVPQANVFYNAMVAA